MSHRNPHPSLTPKRALALLLKVLDESSDIKWRLAECRDALADHVRAALDRNTRRPRKAKVGAP